MELHNKDYTIMRCIQGVPSLRKYPLATFFMRKRFASSCQSSQDASCNAGFGGKPQIAVLADQTTIRV